MIPREEAIRYVIEASDGFGRAYGADLEMMPQLEDFQPCVVELARHIVYLRMRGVPLPGAPGLRLCDRPGCPNLFPAVRRARRYCSTLCGIRESRRRRATERRARERGRP